ncbi:MAG: hypothetical protein ACRDIU_01185 [Actinomycetota bacterium]
MRVSQMGTAAMHGKTVGRGPNKARTFPSGRRCTYEGCSKLLSMYNPRATCYRHTPISMTPLRAPRRSTKV